MMQGVDVEQQLTQDELDRLSERIGELLDRVENNSDSAMRGDVFELLQHVDTLHREALARLLTLLRETDPALVHPAADPVLRLVLSLYDLLPGLAGEAPASEIMPLQAARTRPKWLAPGFIPLEVVGAPAMGGRRARAPVFVSALALVALDEGCMRGLEVERERVLLCRLSGEVYAFRNVCPGSALPLDLGRLDGTTLVCPWHECRFDARTGKRLDAGEGRLAVIPVSVSDGEIRLAVGVATA